MDRINHSTATPDRKFTAGSAAGAIPATIMTAEWPNMVQEELVNLVLAAGLVLDPTDDTQLAQAVQALIADHVITVPPASEAEAGIIKLATLAQVLAGVGGGSVTPETLATRLAALPAPAVITGSARNLAMSATGLSALVSMTAEELIVKDATGNTKLISGLALSASTAAMGAGGLDTGAIAGSTWYAVWAIAKTDGTAALLLSLSATAPTLPAGYSYMARVGWIRTDATANKYPLAFKQVGRRVQYIVGPGTNVAALPLLASGVAGDAITPAYVSVAVGNAIPPSAVAIVVGLYNNTAQASALVAPSPAYGSFATPANPPIIAMAPANAAGMSTHISSMVLESSNIYWASAAVTAKLFCSGWED